jgi:hypothetical protein
MPRQYHLTTYAFKELSDKAKKVALEAVRKLAADDDHSDEITEDFKTRLDELGYPTDDVNWSLGCCQGDGVAFYGTVDRERVIARLYAGDAAKISKITELMSRGLLDIEIVRNSHGTRYSHSRTMTLEDHWERADEADTKFIADVASDILDDIRATSSELEKSGYEMIAYYNEDSTLIDDAEALDYEFLESGRMAKTDGAEEMTNAS